MMGFEPVQAGGAPSVAGRPTSGLPRLSGADGFVDWIARDWAPQRVPTGVPEGAAESAGGHRAALSDAFPGDTLVIASGHAPARNDDCDFAFRPDSAFVWLTGCQAEGAVLVMHAVPGGHDPVLHLPRPSGPGDSGFYDDVSHGELWAGPLPTLDAWADDLGLPVRPLWERPGVPYGKALLSASAVRAGMRGGVASPELDRVLSTLRMVKDEWEITQLRGAVDATVTGFAAVAAEIPRAVEEGLGERWLQGTFDRHARTFGNGAGYTTIVGSGAHAPVLHWSRCDGPVRADAAVLLDMGVESRTLYTADVTRTLPGLEGFTPAERAVHGLVERAHRAALEVVRPGRGYSDYQMVAMEVLAVGLDAWGLLPVSVDEALSERGQHHRRFICCSIGHHLGLDVHDCSRAAPSDYSGGTLRKNMVLAVEPGLYFHGNDLSVPPEFRGIGVRIEDDVLVTAQGNDVLSAALPLDADGLQDWTSRQQR